MKDWKHVGIALAACLLLVLMAVPALAAGRQYGAFTYEMKGNGTVTITDFDWSKHSGGDVYVPRSIDGYQVTEIGTMAFSDDSVGMTYQYGKKNLSTTGQAVAVILPDTITVIAEKAFFCTKIASCNIPASVHTIGSGAFAGCINMRQFSVHSQNKTYAVISGVLFEKGAKELVAFPLACNASGGYYAIPEGIKSIGDYAFYALYGYGDTNSSFPETLTSIGSYSFYGAEIEFYQGPPALQTIGDYAFAHCDITISSDRIVQPEYIGAYAFYDCSICGTGRKYYAFSFDKVKQISEGSFASMSFVYYEAEEPVGKSFKSSQIEYIPPHAFECIHWYVSLPPTVTEIGEYAFAQSRSMGSIPASVTVIGKRAFMEAVGSVYFPDDSKLRKIGDEAYLNANIATPLNVTLPDGVESVGYRAFYTEDTTKYKSSLKKLIIPSSVNHFGDEVVNRTYVVLQVSPGSYADLWATENGYPMEVDDTSWLFE